MTRFRKRVPSPALVLACVALAVALAGTGYAAITLPRNSVTTVQVKDFSLLARDFKRGQLPAGPQGPAGPAGAAGAAARWALVNGAGQILQQSGGISSRRVGDGYYVLDFGSTIAGKLILASSARTSDDREPRGTVWAGECTLAAPGDNCATGNDPRFVAVHTNDASNGFKNDHAFYVAVLG
jgi:hypothetical protein